MPPFAHTAPGRMLGISQTRDPPRLKKTNHSEGLCDLVAYVLEASPANRPSMEKVLQNAYVVDTEESHSTTSLIDLVKKYYQWEQSGGQRQSLFNPGGAQAAEFPEDLDEAEEEWNFSTTANFDQQFAGQLQPLTTSTELATGLEGSNIAGRAPQPAEDSFDSYLLEPQLYTPLSSPGFASMMAEPYHEDLTSTNTTHQDEAMVEDRVQRGGKALQNLFDEEADPYKYNIKSETDNQGLGHYEAHHRPAAGRAKSDLPLRNETQSTSLSRKEFDVTDINQAKGSILNIDLANVNTIKANRMNRATGGPGSNDEDENDNYGGFKEPKRATMGWTFGNAGTTEEAKGKAKEAKRTTKDWTLPATVDMDDSDMENTPVFREPKRDTRAFVFPQMQPADDVRPSIPKRPALTHATTAPVGEPLRSESGVIDLDALMMTDAAPHERDLMRAAFNDEEPTVTTSGASSDNEFNMITAEDRTSGDTLGKNALLSASSTDDEGEDNPFDPLAWKEWSDEELKAEIDQELTAQGILDPMIRAIKRRELLKQRKEAQAYLKQDLEEAGYNEWKKQGSQVLPGFDDFPGK